MHLRSIRCKKRGKDFKFETDIVFIEKPESEETGF